MILREVHFHSQILLTFSNPSQLFCNMPMLLKSFSERKPSQCLLKSECWKIFNLLKCWDKSHNHQAHHNKIVLAVYCIILANQLLFTQTLSDTNKSVCHSLVLFTSWQQFSCAVQRSFFRSIQHSLLRINYIHFRIVF